MKRLQDVNTDYVLQENTMIALLEEGRLLDVMNLCTVDKLSASICSKNLFWKKAVETHLKGRKRSIYISSLIQDFVHSKNLPDSPPRGRTWKQYYIHTFKFIDRNMLENSLDELIETGNDNLLNNISLPYLSDTEITNIMERYSKKMPPHFLSTAIRFLARIFRERQH